MKSCLGVLGGFAALAVVATLVEGGSLSSALQQGVGVVLILLGVPLVALWVLFKR